MLKNTNYYTKLNLVPEAVTGGVLKKMAFLELSQNSQSLF